MCSVSPAHAHVWQACEKFLSPKTLALHSGLRKRDPN